VGDGGGRSDGGGGGGSDDVLVSRAEGRAAVRDNAAFFLSGLFNNLVYVVYLAAAEDLVQNKAGVILLFNTLPGLISKLVLPFFADRLSYTLRVTVTCVTLCMCCVGVAVSTSIPARLTCIALSSCAGCLGEITFLALTSRYNPSTIGFWSSGTGFAGISGSAVYFFIRSSLGLSSRHALLAIAPFSLVMLMSYQFVLTPSHGSPAYTGILAASDAAEGAPPTSPSTDATPAACVDDAGYESVVFEPPPPGVSLRRVALPWLVAQYVAPLSLVYFSEYMINQGVSPTLDRFTSDAPGGLPLDAAGRSHLYTLYQTAYQSGVFLSRSSIEFVKFPRIWLLPPVQFANLAVLLAAALFNFLPHRYCVVAIMFFEGVVGGGMYVNAFYKLRRTVPSELRAWALGAASVGDTFGITLAAVVNIFLECGIRRLRGEATCRGES
jgi:battenin